VIIFARSKLKAWIQ